MTISLSRLIEAPIGEVYACFNDPASTMQLNEHVVRFEVVDEQPDGRRTFDVVLRSGSKEWMQTIEELVQEPPTRLVTRGGSWTTDRRQWLLTITTDRRFRTDGGGTRVDVTVESHLEHPLRHPIQATLNWLRQGATRTVFERQLGLIARRIEGAEGADLEP